MHRVNGEKVNILMVDDQPAKLLSYEAMLHDLGETLIRASSGNEVFSILLQEEIAVILLDVNMPDMDGFETASAIREHPRFAKTPIIFVTAVNTTDFDRMRGYEIGAVDYVSVPVIPAILRAKVSVFVELHRKNRQMERLNESLRDSERHMRAILETANEAILTLDDAGVIQSINPAGERIFQYAAAEIVGQSIQQLLAPHFRSEKEQPNLLDLSGAIHGLRKEGSVIPLECSISEVLPGKVYTGIFRDISRRRELEREVTETAAAEQRRIGQELHDGIAQELTGLTLMAATLREQLVDSSSETMARRLQEGLNEVHKHVRDISHGLIPVDVDAEGLRAALEELADRVHLQAGIVCTFHCPQPVSVRDSFTATHLFHIAQEAVNNALRHGRARRIDISLHAPPESLVLHVRDDGIGINGDANQHNGVGLRIMHHRASLIGGVLRIRPAINKGTLVACTVLHKPW